MSNDIHPARSAGGVLRSGPFSLQYKVEGRGRPVLVVGSVLYYPRTFSAALRQHLQLAFVDHRGFAPLTEPANEPVTAADFAFETVLEDIERLRAHLGLGKIVILGHSGHGYMALEYAKRYPKHVSHVVMIATGPSHNAEHMTMAERHWQEAVCPARKAKLEREMAQLPADLAAAPEKRFIAFCLRMGARSWHDHDFDAAPLWDGVHVNMAGFDHLWGEVFRDIDITRGLEALDIPVLLALGRFDYLVAPYEAWTPYRPLFRDLTVRVFDRSSHTPQLEESEAFDSVLLEWLKSR
ncbi:alpha/beta hydrolase [uncultured Ferrovibrio sp.]|jgi:Predicted hydrolases or acyltransferases (alpha/beta hydrolase superfamily)|uniref:alpha/beta fold hydrolase n=1 Tax=uncultured Ferrovibrio sp. TaxID=1576913 RepID=UPI002621375C|nr:alpha/beta hydrolase [uncultured Ferrovibrio sp.]